MIHGAVKNQGFEELHEQWERILPYSAANSIFLTPHWQRIWWEEFGADSQLCLLAIPTDSVHGVAPLMISDGIITFLGDTDLFDYHDFLVPEGLEEGFFHFLVDYLEAMDWRSIDLRSIRGGSPTIGMLSSLAKDKGYEVEVSEEDVSPGMVLPDSWEEFVTSLSKKDRHELRRKIRRLEREGEVRLHALTDPEQISEGIDDFLRLLRMSRTDKAEFMIPEREKFFRKATQELAKKQQVRLYFLELNGVRVASALCFDYSGTFYLYNSGYDPEYSSLSVGLVSKALCVKDAIEEGRHFFDFLRGAEPYKYHLGGRDRILFRMVISK